MSCQGAIPKKDLQLESCPFSGAVCCPILTIPDLFIPVREGVDTLGVLVNLDIAARHIEPFQDCADRYRVRVPSRIKTHKARRISDMRLGAGAVGITRQKVSGAEAMIAAGASPATS